MTQWTTTTTTNPVGPHPKNETKGKIKETEGKFRGDVGKATGDTSEHLKGSGQRSEGQNPERLR
jgi:uncharacterized protein YjbJ (UPF0337 family)